MLSPEIITGRREVSFLNNWDFGNELFREKTANRSIEIDHIGSNEDR